MGVESGDLVDFGQGQPHLLGERHQMAGGEGAEAVLNCVQMLDQEMAPAVAYERAHLLQCGRVELPGPWDGAPPGADRRRDGGSCGPLGSRPRARWHPQGTASATTSRATTVT